VRGIARREADDIHFNLESRAGLPDAFDKIILPGAIAENQRAARFFWERATGFKAFQVHEIQQ